MKRIILIVIISLAAVIAGAVICGYLFWEKNYEGTDVSGVPVTTVNVAGQEVPPIASIVSMPVLGEYQEQYPELFDILDRFFDGYRERRFMSYHEDGGWRIVTEKYISETDQLTGAYATDLGLLGDVPHSFDVGLPSTMGWNARLEYIDASGGISTVITGGTLGSGPDTQDIPASPPSADASADIDIPVTSETEIRSLFGDGILLKKAGDYRIIIEGSKEKTGPADYSGVFHYEATFSLKNPDPLFSVGQTALAQGDILSLMLKNVPEGIVPGLESKLGPAIFTMGVPFTEDDPLADFAAEGFANWYAMVPISNTRATGEYPITIHAGEMVYEILVTVNEFDFDFMDLIIDYNSPNVASATTPQAGAEFSAVVLPLMPLMSEERHWDGVFIMPVDLGKDGFISSTFGEIRITNGNMGTRRTHNGLDLAVSTGTPVYASNAGRVLVSEFLLSTGYTVVIDHGGGLKSYYYHMDSVDAVVGTIVQKGELIGTVGSTGYSTGPHLHFETRIGEQPISPEMLFDPAAGLYSANQK